MTPQLQTATLGGGCFWCLEAVYQELDGVGAIVSGYAGGKVPNPTYEQICGKETGHAEVVQLTFDSSKVSFRHVLEVFFAIHDPTTPNRQGNDVGPQYRSVIFYTNDEQQATARAMIAELTAERVFDAPIVTEVTALPVFYPGESYHQDYYRQHRSQPYCTFVISPKLAKFRQNFARKAVRITE